MNSRYMAQRSTRMRENEMGSEQLQWVTWNRDNFQVFEVDNFFHLFRQEFMRRLFLLFLLVFSLSFFLLSCFICHHLLGHSISPLLNRFHCYFYSNYFFFSCWWVRNVPTKCFLFYALLAFSSILTIIRSWSPYFSSRFFFFLSRALYAMLEIFRSYYYRQLMHILF